MKFNVPKNYVLPAKVFDPENDNRRHEVFSKLFAFYYVSCVQAQPFVLTLEVSCGPQKYFRCGMWFYSGSIVLVCSISLWFSAYIPNFVLQWLLESNCVSVDRVHYA